MAVEIKSDEFLVMLYQGDGDHAALDEMVERYINLVYKIARHFSENGSFEDVVQVGTIGLLKSIERFDTNREVTFSTYATPTIVGEIKRYFRDQGKTLKLPRTLQEQVIVFKKFNDSFGAKHHRRPTATEVAEHLSVTDVEAGVIMGAAEAHMMSLDMSPVGFDDDETTLASIIGGNDAALERAEHRVLLNALFKSLSPREREILYQRFYEGLPQSSIAENIGVSQMHVSRLISRAIKKMQQQVCTEP